MMWRMSTASDLLAKYLVVEAAILEGQSYRMGERMLTRADLAAVQAERKNLERRVSAESNTASGGFRHSLGSFQ